MKAPEPSEPFGGTVRLDNQTDLAALLDRVIAILDDAGEARAAAYVDMAKHALRSN